MLQINFSDSDLNYSLLTHPDYPGLVSLIDAFKGMTIPYICGKSSFENLSQIDQPVIAHISADGGSFVIIKKIKNGIVVFFDAARGWVKMSERDFVTEWTNIILLVDTDELSKLQKDAPLKTLALLKYPVPTAFLIAVTTLAIFSYYTHVNIIFSLVVLAGLISSIIVFVNDLGISSSLKSRLCRSKGVFNCDAVLTSPGAKLFGILKLSDVCLLFFSAETFSVLLSVLTRELKPIVFILCILSLLTSPIAILSIIYQKFIIKAWCPFCLVVILSLGIQSWLGLSQWPSGLESLRNIRILETLITGLMTSMFLWLVLKPLLKSSRQNKLMAMGYKKAIRNKETILALLSREKYIELDLNEGDLILGPGDSQIIIVTVLNPYCGPCKVAHNEVEKLLPTVKQNIRHLIRFSKSLNEEQNQISRHIIAMKDSYQIEEIHRAIHKWFKIMDYEKWARSYPVEFSSLSAQRLVQHFSWCDSNGIDFTPAIIVQNRLKPTILDVNDLKYLYDT